MPQMWTGRIFITTDYDVRAEPDCEPWERRRLVGRWETVGRNKRASGTPALPKGERMRSCRSAHI